MGIEPELLAYLKRRHVGPLISSSLSELRDEITKLEEWIGYRLPSAYSEWLQTFEYATFDTTSIFGMCGDGNLRQQQSDYQQRGWLNIANDGCGNYYVLVLTGEFGISEPIIFVDGYQELSDAYIVASDFTHFLRGTLVYESDEWHWPFSWEKIASFDPNMLTAINVRFPWDDE